MTDPETLLRAMFDAAVDVADPMTCVPPHLPEPPKGRLVVVGAGKASARMAQAVEAHWDGPLEGVVVTRYGHAAPAGQRPCERIRVVEAAHPVPDEAGVAATRAILDAVSRLTADDLVLALISGGGSALLTAPAEGVTLAEKQALNHALLRSGAPIDEMNAVRRRLSRVKGGRLAQAAAPARVLTLAISDVPGDDPAVIASGPTVVCEAADVAAILARHGIEPPPSIRAVLARADDAPRALPNAETRVIAAPQRSLEAAAEVARGAGVTPLILGDAIEGESREVARVHAGIAAQVRRHAQPIAPPCVLISGGETTVTVRGEGRGGRNVEFALALAVALDGAEGIHAIAADTDGVDGAEETAGAVIGPTTLARAREAGIDAARSLEANDGHGFFESLSDRVVTGPTLTNVNDFRAVLVAG